MSIHYSRKIGTGTYNDPFRPALVDAHPGINWSAVDNGGAFAVVVPNPPAELLTNWRFPLVSHTSPTFEAVRNSMRSLLGQRPDAGVTITLGAQTVTLPATPGFAARFTQRMAAYREAGMAGSASVTIRTYGGERTVTLTQLRAAYKLYMDGLEAIVAPLDKVDTATTMADLDAVTL